MEKAIGIIETLGMPTALIAADMMAKAGNIQIVGIKNSDAGLVSILIQGNTGDVKAALGNALSSLRQMPGSAVVSHCLLPCPEGIQTDTTLSQHSQASTSHDELGWLDD